MQQSADGTAELASGCDISPRGLLLARSRIKRACSVRKPSRYSVNEYAMYLRSLYRYIYYYRLLPSYAFLCFIIIIITTRIYISEIATVDLSKQVRPLSYSRTRELGVNYLRVSLNVKRRVVVIQSPNR